MNLEFKNLTARLPKILENFSIDASDISLAKEASLSIAVEQGEQNISQIQPDINVSEMEQLTNAQIKIQKGQIIKSQLEFEQLMNNLAKETIISLNIHASTWAPLSNDAVVNGEPAIFGFALAWDEGAAYIPIRPDGSQSRWRF